MVKVKSSFFCQECGYEAPKWMGKCPSCNSWNTFVEETVTVGSTEPYQTIPGSNGPAKAVIIDEVSATNEKRIKTSSKEFNRVLGGGIVPGSLVLIGGEPGVGKSTLMLQIGFGVPGKKVLYISGEESEQQIKMRAERLKKKEAEFYILTETNTQNIFKQIERVKPDLLVIDSIQTLHSAMIDSFPGSISQVRHCSGELLKYAKESGVPVFLIGHITKDGAIAGPKVMEHMVDTVLQLEGDRHLVYRILRTMKNRFGSTSEMGLFEMTGTGLKEVTDPSQILLSHKNQDLSGISIGASLEGNRPLLIEIQSLVSPAAYGTPQRSTTGYDPRRVNMLLAVLERRSGFKMGTQDVFLNLAGGLKVDDTSIDLAICTSIVSSMEDIPISQDICFAAEIGLGGELRGVPRIESRISEAEKLGFKEIFISSFAREGLELKKHKIEIRGFDKISGVFSKLFG